MAYNEEQIDRIMLNVRKINKSIVEADEDLLEYAVESVIDRALLFLNHKDLDEKFEKIISDVVSGIFNKYKTNLNNSGTDLAVNSISDNGQSVSYSNEIKNYLANSTDNELFSGFAGILARYRRINVISK